MAPAEIEVRAIIAKESIEAIDDYDRDSIATGGGCGIA